MARLCPPRSPRIVRVCAAALAVLTFDALQDTLVQGSQVSPAYRLAIVEELTSRPCEQVTATIRAVNLAAVDSALTADTAAAALDAALRKQAGASLVTSTFKARTTASSSSHTVSLFTRCQVPLAAATARGVASVQCLSAECANSVVSSCQHVESLHVFVSLSTSVRQV